MLIPALHTRRLALVGLALGLVSQSALAQSLSVDKAQVRAVPPASTNSAAFMVLHNEGEEDLAVVDARSPVADVTELHNHMDVDGVMQMRRVSEVPVPAGGYTELAPGGLHLMLIDLVAPLHEGEEVELTLVLDSGESLTLDVPVKRVEAMGAGLSGQGRGHTHGQHDH